MHPLEVALEWLEIRGNCGAGEFRVQAETAVPLLLPDVRVEGEKSFREIRARCGDAVARHREPFRVDAPSVHGPPDLVRRERRDWREEPQDVPEARVERPSRARVAFVRATLHHLDVVRREQVPEEIPSAGRGQKEVQVLVAAAAHLDEPVQLREDPLVCWLELRVWRLVEGGDEARDVPELRDELRGATDLVLADPEVVAGIRLARDEDSDRVGPMLLDERPGVDHVPEGAVHRAAARVEAEAVDEHPVERLRSPDEPRLERRVVEPRSDDLAALWPKRQREVRLEELRVRPVPRQEEVRDRKST